MTLQACLHCPVERFNRPAGARDRLNFRWADAVEYWEGE